MPPNHHFGLKFKCLVQTVVLAKIFFNVPATCLLYLEFIVLLLKKCKINYWLLQHFIEANEDKFFKKKQNKRNQIWLKLLSGICYLRIAICWDGRSCRKEKLMSKNSFRRVCRKFYSHVFYSDSERVTWREYCYIVHKSSELLQYIR